MQESESESESEIVHRILETLSISAEEYVRKPRAGHPGWTNKEFISFIVVHETTTNIVKHLGCGEQTVNRAINKLLTPIVGKLNGGNETFRNKLLHIVQIKKCPKCARYLGYSEYGIDSSNSYGTANYCKQCTSERNKMYYDTNKDRYHKHYIAEHRSEYTARNANRRAARLRATPSWANIDLIKEIYACAEGMHVDHIIPLQGETVCGLHVENNLQYLTPEENLKKGNRLLEEYL